MNRVISRLRTLIVGKFSFRYSDINMSEVTHKSRSAPEPATGEPKSSATIDSDNKKRTIGEVGETGGEIPEKKMKTSRNYGTTDKEHTGPVSEKPEFYFESRLRKVRPYWFRHATWAKGRWLGRSLGEVFRTEMHAKDPDYFKQQVELGRVTVNDKSTTVDHILKDNDRIKNVLHRHEMPVLDTPIEIILNNDNVLVVNKPCSIPTHPCGRYYYNSLTYLLKHQFGFEDFRITHRLDRMTSGLVIFAKTLSKAQDLFTQHSQREVHKEYVCRVAGNFPDDEVCCDQPLAALFAKMGIHGVSANGRTSRTRFRKLFSDGDESVVRCFLETGRTHQIRVHLQYLGYPIVNDYLYNCDVFGPQKGKNGDYGKSVEQLCEDISVAFGAESWVDDFDASLATYLSKRPALSTEAAAAKPDPSSPHYDPYCADCHITSRDPSVDELKMYLHCLKYEGPNWSYSTPLPDWALQNNSREESAEEQQIAQSKAST